MVSLYHSHFAHSNSPKYFIETLAVTNHIKKRFAIMNFILFMGDAIWPLNSTSFKKYPFSCGFTLPFSLCPFQQSKVYYWDFGCDKSYKKEVCYYEFNIVYGWFNMTIAFHIIQKSPCFLWWLCWASEESVCHCIFLTWLTKHFGWAKFWFSMENV